MSKTSLTQLNKLVRLCSEHSNTSSKFFSITPESELICFRLLSSAIDHLRLLWYVFFEKFNPLRDLIEVTGFTCDPQFRAVNVEVSEGIRGLRGLIFVLFCTYDPAERDYFGHCLQPAI